MGAPLAGHERVASVPVPGDRGDVEAAPPVRRRRVHVEAGGVRDRALPLLRPVREQRHRPLRPELRSARGDLGGMP